MKILNFKKGTEVISNWPFWILFAIVAGVVALVLVNIANVNVEEASRIPPDLEDELLLASRFYNSEECFVYQDDVGRVYPKVIDASKFTQENMDKCFPESDVNYAFSLALRVPALDEPPIHTFELGPLNTHKWAEGTETRGIIENIFVFYDGEKYSGKLAIQIKNV